MENQTTAEARIDHVVELYQEYVNPGLASLMRFGGFGDVEVSASGCVVRTASGAEYLDFLGGYGVFTVGHRHPKVVEAVKRQLDSVPLSSRTFFSEPTAQLAQQLAQISPGNLQYSFFSNSGTEAVEAALKIARIATGRSNFVCTIGGFHGKSMGALSATGREMFREPFNPLVPGFVHVPFDDAEAARTAITEQTAAVIVETIQGEGGIRVASPNYMPALRQYCNAAGALLIADEVQTGLGRTGAMFGCDHTSTVPDIMTLAKALSGGVMPIGATVATAEIWQAAFGANPLIHTSTFGGNPLACAAALATLQVIEDEGLIAAANVRGAQLLAGLNQVQRANPGALLEARGMGLMLGLEFAVKDVAELTINGLARRGIIAAYTLNNPRVIRLEPPLVVTPAQVDTAVNAMGEAVSEAAAALEGM